MRNNSLILSVMAVAIPCIFAAAETAHPAWTGVWQGELDGQPGVILTLAEDAGELSGTVVFNVVIKKDGQAHVAGSAVHMVRHPQLGTDTLEFHVTRKSDGRDLDMRVRKTGSDTAELQCQNCGQENPVAELKRSN